MNIYKLIENYKWSKDKPSRQAKINTVDFFKLCFELEEGNKVAEHLGVNVNTVSKWLNSYPEIPKGRSYVKQKILSIFGLRNCPSCETIQPSENFHEVKTNSYCKPCRRLKNSDWFASNPGLARTYASNYRAARLQRTPAWANQKKIQEIYSNCPEGYHVDHIVPLQGELVSGLHVENNLQYLPASENSSKGNKFQVG